MASSLRIYRARLLTVPRSPRIIRISPSSAHPSIHPPVHSPTRQLVPSSHLHILSTCIPRTRPTDSPTLPRPSHSLQNHGWRAAAARHHTLPIKWPPNPGYCSCHTLHNRTLGNRGAQPIFPNNQARTTTAAAAACLLLVACCFCECDCDCT